MKHIIALILLLCASAPAIADDIQLLKSSLTNDGVKYTKTYLASIEKATSVPCDPLNGNIPVSFNKALFISFDSIPEKERFEKIELWESELRLCISEPRFYYWHLRFMTTPKGKIGRVYHVILLMDGSVVEPKIEEVISDRVTAEGES